MLRTILTVVLSIAAIASAQPLADRVSGDALVYVAWSGSRSLGPAYETSRLKAVIDATDTQRLFTETFPRLAERIGQESPQGGEAFAMVSAIASRVWKHPTAFAFTGLDFTNPRNPQPMMTVLCDAGDDAPALLKDLQAAIAKAGPSKIPLNVSADKNLVMLKVGTIAPATTTLAANAKFKETLAKVHEKPVSAIYVDIEGLLSLVDRAPVKGQRGQRDRDEWHKVRDALGLQNAKAAIWTGAFDGKDWSGKAFVAAPAPRTGVMSLFDGKPITDDLLKRVPATAAQVIAGTFDPAKLLADVRATSGKIDPQAPQKIQQGLDQFKQMTGLDLETDLLAPLGEQWTAYADPNINGAFSFSMCLMNKLDDPAKAEQSFTQFGKAVSGFATGLMAREKMQLDFRELKDGDQTIRYFALPIVRPSWTIRDGVLYVGLWPQVVSAAVRADTAKSILQNEAFVALRQKLSSGKPITSISYTDLPRTAPLMYTTWVMVSGYAGFGDLFGVPTPAMLLPPLDKLLAQLTPAGSVTWVDESGWHCAGRTPFPGARAIASDPTVNIGTSALLVSILLPSLNRARETANRVKCASNERQIGQAMLLYANDNKGRYPADMGTLLKTQDITIDVFLCPSSNNEVPPEIRNAPIDTQAAWVNDNASYVYLGAGKRNTAGAEDVMVHEHADNHDGDGMNFLFGDGHVTWEAMEMAEPLIQKAGVAK